MPNAIDTQPRPAVGVGRADTAAIGFIAWLDDLLDLARDRGDGALARQVAGAMDGLGAAAKG